MVDSGQPGTQPPLSAEPAAGRPALPSRPPGQRRRRASRDRHGRGLRRPLVEGAPRAELLHLPAVPWARSRAEMFADLVLDAVEELELRWAEQLAGVEFAVEDVPEDGEVSADGDPVALSRLTRAGGGRNGTPARIIVYRRPVEARAADRFELADLVLDLVIHEVARLLNTDPAVIDPEGHADDEADDED